MSDRAVALSTAHFQFQQPNARVKDFGKKLERWPIEFMTTA